MVRPLALTAAIVVSLLAVSGAGGTAPQSPRRGGTVVDGFTLDEPPCLNWWLAECHRGEGWDALIDKTLLPALGLGPHGWRNVLVSSETLTKKPFTVTYHIRPEARWSDGVPVTASDFVFSYEMSLKYNGPDPNLPLRSVIRRVVPVNAKTLKVVYRKPVTNWREYLQRPLPQHLLVGTDFASVWKDGIDDPRTGEPIGDGPFLVQSWEKGKQLVLVRNPNYWGPHPAYLDRLVFRFVLQSDLADALQSGAVDLLGDDQSQGTTFDIAKEPPPGIRVLSVPGPGWEHFEIRVGRGGAPALRKTLVRRALAYGVDRHAIVRKLFADIAPEVRPLDSTMYLPTEPEYRPNWIRYRYNPTLARKLLVKAGCRRGGDGIFTCAGERLSLRFVTNGDNPRREQTIRIVQPQLRRIGVVVVPTYAPKDIYFGPILQNGNFDVALFAWSHDPGNVQSSYRCQDRRFSGYCSRAVTADNNQLVRAPDPQRQAVLANEIDRLLARAVPAIPLFQGPNFTAFRDKVHGVVPSAFNDPTWDAENWWVER